jgi:hypothetical protein
VTEADAALLVAHDDECRETESLAALHHLGDAVDVDELVDHAAVTIIAVVTAIARTSASSLPL